MSTACTPASGAQFPIGTSTVTCTATDAAAQTGTCNFAVRVFPVQLSLKKFQSIGDSLTEGENGLPFQPSFLDPPNSYPSKLRGLLDAAFPSQGIVLANRGISGQRIEQTLDLLSGNLANDRPEIVMLLGGFNNLILPCHDGIPISDPGCDAAIEFLEDTLREVVHEAKRFSSVRYVLVSTLTPPGPIAANAQNDRRINRAAIIEVNSRIRAAALAEGALIIETYQAFLGHEAEYTSIDGVHLRPAGYQAIADLFFAKIVSTVPQSNSFSIR